MNIQTKQQLQSIGLIALGSGLPLVVGSIAIQYHVPWKLILATSVAWANLVGLLTGRMTKNLFE